MASRITVHPDFSVGSIDPRLYGSFVEHLGRCVYSGIYEPGHPTADEDGFRGDVLGMVRELEVPIVRYPGGNFVSGYKWEDGVGPRGKRPRQLDPAWRTIETNEFGTNEFMAWCLKAKAEPMLAVNLGTRGMAEARALLEYCNLPGGTEMSDLRRTHGNADPYGVKTWCLGNEMDGKWQMGHKTAAEYGRLACETGRLMKMIDPDIELVVCGSSNSTGPTYPAWDAEVLEYTFEIADFISAHLYLHTKFDAEGKRLRKWADFVGQPTTMDRHIETIVAACDFAQAKARSRKKIMISFDEWNVWWHSLQPNWPRIEDWSIAPAQLEDNYTMEDALVFGGMLLSLIRHADRVRIACVAQLVNVLGPILTHNGGPAWRQTIYYPLLHAARHGRGESLRVPITCPLMETAELGLVAILDCAATYRRDLGEISLFIINRMEHEEQRVCIDLRGFGKKSSVIEHTILSNANHQLCNTAETPDEVTPRGAKVLPLLENGELDLHLPPASWNLVRLRVKGR